MNTLQALVRTEGSVALFAGYAPTPRSHPPARTVVIYKGGRRMPRVADRLRTAARLDRAVLGELLGMPGERIIPVADVADRPSAYLSAVIAPADMRAS